MGPSTERVTISWVPWIFAACSIIRCTSKGQSCINPSIPNFLQNSVIAYRSALCATGFHGIAMKFSADPARRKWPCRSLPCGQRPMVTVAAMLLAFCVQAAPVAAAQRPGVWPQGPFGDLFGGPRPRPRRVVVLPGSIPLPKPRPADAPSAAPGPPAEAKQAPPAEHDAPPPTPAVPAPQLSACRQALTEDDRHRPQHSRYPRPRRLRRRGSGAAGGGGAGGQAQGRAEARGDPAMQDGFGDRRLGPHRHRRRSRRA